MKKTFFITCIALVVMSVFILPAMAADATLEELQTANIARLGYFTLIPPIVAIGLAFITKNVVASLLLGVLSGTFLIALGNFNFILSIYHSFIIATEKMLLVLSDSWNAGVILQVLAIGGLIALVTKLGGTRALAEKLAVKAKGPVSVQIVTWLLGIIVFFDDYANSLIVGPVMRPLMDKMKISREKFAYIVDATAAPIAGIALISTWIGTEIGTIRDGFSQVTNSTLVSGIEPYSFFVMTIPYRFYNILTLAFIVVSALLLKDFGPMLKAEKEARLSQPIMDQIKVDVSVYEEAASEGEELQPGPKTNIWNAIIPLGCLIVFSFIGFYLNGLVAIGGAEALSGNMFSWESIKECFSNADASIVIFQVSLFCCMIAIVMGLWQKIFKLDQAINIFVTGVKSLIITCVILILAWSLSSTVKELGTAKFLVSALSESVPKFLLPSIIFALGSLISFATGTSYGTMGILMPLAIPFAVAMPGADLTFVVMSAGAVLTGAIFGDHCSPISDTTILSSMGAGCDHIKHVNTQITYALVVAAITIVFGYIPVGLGLNVWVSLLLGLVAVFLVIYLFGKRADAQETVPLNEPAMDSSN